MLNLKALALPLTFALVACELPADEYRDALPERDTLVLDYPAADTSASGLHRAALVGAPSDFYSQTYYTARELNAFGVLVVTLVETITKYPASDLGDDYAVWGPFSDRAEPNEFKLTVDRRVEDALVYGWAIEGRHKSQGDDGWVAITRGHFAPREEGSRDGRGWFTFDFESLRTLNPAENGKGRIAYAFEVNGGEASVKLHYQGENERGEPAQAAYAYGHDESGAGYVLFAFQDSLDHTGTLTRLRAGGRDLLPVIPCSLSCGDKKIFPKLSGAAALLVPRGFPSKARPGLHEISDGNAVLIPVV